MPTTTDRIEGLIDQALRRGQRSLSEHDSKCVLGVYGVPVVGEELVQEVSQAVAAAERLGYPVVVKACSGRLMHKSDQGLVMLNLNDASDVELAVAEIRNTIDSTQLDGFLVQRMIRGKREVIIGGSRDTLFGPCVMLGLGGILVEAVADVAFRLAPVSQCDAMEMINELRAQRIFDEFRGEPAADREALGRVLMAVGQILIDHPRISQVDVNPLIFSGAQPVAVDALVALSVE